MKNDYCNALEFTIKRNLCYLNVQLLYMQINSPNTLLLKLKTKIQSMSKKKKLIISNCLIVNEPFQKKTQKYKPPQ